jgi:hypothetical protein
MPALVAALFAFALAWTSPAQTKLRGVVVETYGGISENGVQTTHLLTPGGEYMLHYGKRDFKPKFARPISSPLNVTAPLITACTNRSASSGSISTTCRCFVTKKPRN